MSHKLFIAGNTKRFTYFARSYSPLLVLSELVTNNSLPELTFFLVLEKIIPEKPIIFILSATLRTLGGVFLAKGNWWSFGI